MVSTFRRQIASGTVLAVTMGSLSGCSSNPVSPSGPLFFSFSEIRVGVGDPAENGDVVTLNYTAWLFDEDAEDSKGQEVDSGQGLEFILGADQVIPAFDQGVVGMRVTGLRELSIPPGFVGNGAGVNNIPPDMALVADVEMVDIQTLRSDTAPFAIIDLQIGSGLEARAGDTLRVAYSGWLFDNDAPENKGTLFEMSPSTGFVFTLGQGDVIDGWEQGVPGMRVGGERRLIVPPELAFGDTSNVTIPPDATLVFDLQLLQILQ